MAVIVTEVITPQILTVLRTANTLHWHGIHGVTHWQRVRENGLRLAQMNGADALVVELFAFLHDIKRVNDGHDPQHGQRAADFVRTLCWTRHGQCSEEPDRDGALIRLSDAQFEHLTYACAHHTEGLVEGPLTVRTCWDADRLDLGRVGIIPDPRRLCTAAARDPDIRQWAIRRSQNHPSG